MVTGRGINKKDGMQEGLNPNVVLALHVVRQIFLRFQLYAVEMMKLFSLFFFFLNLYWRRI